MLKDSALRMLLCIILGILFISAGITGRPGSLAGALVDAKDMQEGGTS